MSRRRALLAAAASAALLVPLGLSPAQARPAQALHAQPTAAALAQAVLGQGAPSADAPAVDAPGSAVPLVRPQGLTHPAGQAGNALSPALLGAEGRITAFVEIDAPSGIETTQAGGDAGDVAVAADEVEQIAEDVVPADVGQVAAEVPAKVDVTTMVVPGVVVTGDAASIRALATEPHVAAVHLVVPKTVDAKGTDAFTRAAQAWAAAGATGEGVTIGVVDTGVDYTHATFGGPGTREAYDGAYGTDGTGPVPAGTFDAGKLLGGYDFAGPRYDAGGLVPGSSPAPTPDANPIDAPAATAHGGHGTHVAATAAGYGVQPDGTTFDGDYATLTDLTGWRVGPGSAPEAGIYALKVFGDAGGSTSLVISALEWAADPDGDGDPADHLDIVNLSLGTAFAVADDPENLFVDALAELGTLTVTSAGNEGDVTDVGGSPGSARAALAVASSAGDTRSYDAVEVTQAPDPALVGLHAAQASEDYAGADDVTAPVTYLGDVSGCDPLTAYADQVAGTIVWLWWDDDDATRACGTTTRWHNAQAAGAVGVLIGTELPVFPAAIAGNAGIPGARLTAAATDAVLSAVQGGGVVVRLGPSLAGAAFVTDPALADTLDGESSRGVHGSLGTVKPDVAAPGMLISSAAAGTGTGTVTYTGTSMAAAHVAGIAALTAQTHAEWGPQQIKAAVMNTATHDVHSGLGQTGTTYGPLRVGAGRVDALDAAQAQVIAFDADAPDLVSVTFGVVGVGAEPVVRTRHVTVRNDGATDRTYATSFRQATTAGLAGVTVSPAEVTVPAGGTADVTVTLTADPATLARDLDPTMAATYDVGVTVPRDYVASVTGRLVLTPATGPELRVPVQAAPRPSSDLVAQTVAFGPGHTQAPLASTGRGVASGGWYSLVAPFVLGATSPELTLGDSGTRSALRAADIKAVGWTSTAPELQAAGLDPAAGTFAVGVATYGEWSTLGGAVTPIIDTDVDADGIWDLETYVWKYSAGLDLAVVQTYALTYDEQVGYALGATLEVSLANGLSGALDTSVFDSNVLVAPMSMAAVGITPQDTPTVAVAMYSPYAESPTGIVDETPPFATTPFAPPVWFESVPGDTPDTVENTVWFEGRADAPLVVHRAAEPADAAPQLLVLHTHNAADQRAQLVGVTVAPPLETSTLRAGAPRSVRAGLPVVVPVVVRSEGTPPTGSATVSEAGVELASSRVVTVGSTGFAVLVVRGLPVGTHHLTVAYSGNDRVAGSSVERTVRVTPRS